MTLTMKTLLVGTVALAVNSAMANVTNQNFTNYNLVPTEQIAEQGLPPAPPVPYRWNYSEVETLDSVQKAFSDSKPTDSTLVIDNYNELETYKLRLRVFMSTLIILPNEDEILTFKIGDESIFRVHVNGARVLAVQPEVAGADTSLHIEGKSGNFYTFYLRSDNDKSKYVPHLKVLIKDRHLEEMALRESQKENLIASGFITTDVHSGETDAALAEVSPLANPAKNVTSSDTVSATNDQFDFLEEVSIRPEDFNFNYKIDGSSDSWFNFSSPSDELRPTFVFDDGKFTYFQFGTENTTESASNLPAVFRVVDLSDVPVNTTPFGATLRVEGVNNKWTLRLGTKYLCISRIVPLQKRPTNLAVELK